jgi:hypothetical protein
MMRGYDKSLSFKENGVLELYGVVVVWLVKEGEK